jgi:urease beta subunit
MKNDIARALALLFEPGQVVELRALFGDATASGYYDDMARLAADAEVVEAAQPQGMYVTLNEVNPALLARRENRTKMRLGKKDATTADVDIIRRRWFPVDIDA